MVNLQDYNLEQDCLYEVLACTISKKDEIIYPNTASMGIRILNDKSIKIHPYHNTQTHKNIKEFRVLSLNFIDDVALFAQTSLKEFKVDFSGIPIEDYFYYSYHHKGNSFKIPYLRQAWMVLICNVVKETQIVKQDNFGNIVLTEFELQIFHSTKLRESFKLYNRAENLALECIILATRLKIAKENDDNALYLKIEAQIHDYFDMITKFGRNLSVLRALDSVKEYIKSL
jgi:hypothetical protein